MVLVECKHQKRKVERKEVQVLHSKLQSTGAQKAILFSVSGFQDGAIEFAKIHGIALAQFASGSTSWFTKSLGNVTEPPPGVKIPLYVAWWHNETSFCILSEEHNEYTNMLLGLNKNP